MKKFNTPVLIMFSVILLIISGFSSCQKSNIEATDPSVNMERSEINSISENSPTPANPNFNLEVILNGEGKAFGLVKFRQDNDIAKIVNLDVWVRDLLPNHEYKLQRAVDTNLDGNCTGSAWLTLGKGLTPQSIFTDENGTGRMGLFRNLSAFPSGATFDIHFRVMDVQNSSIVLNSGCYQFTVR